MMLSNKNRIYLSIFVVMLLIPACMCPASDQEIAATRQAATDQAPQATEIAQPTPDPVDSDQQVIAPDADSQPPIADPDETIVFSYTGENQSYHTGLRNRTIFYIDYDTGRVAASEEASFEEPAGTEMTRRGTDSVKFEGTYDANTKSFSGNLNIHTQGTATGGDGNYNNTVTYNMDGILSAQFVDGQWAGTVKGSSTLTQVWPGGEQSDEVTTNMIEWTIIGIPDK
jgi:hypothetical protein